MVTCQVLQELGYGLTREIVTDVIYLIEVQYTAMRKRSTLTHPHSNDTTVANVVRCSFILKHQISVLYTFISSMAYTMVK